MDQDIVKYHVGYRVYLDKGTKKDVVGKKYEGWSEGYDEDILAYSLRLQKYSLPIILLNRPGSISKEGTVYCKKFLDDDPNLPEDEDDVLRNYPIKGDHLYVVQRPPKPASKLFFELIKLFGDSKGYEIILEKMKLASKQFNIDMITALIDIMTPPFYLYHRTFVKEMILPFVNLALLSFQNIQPEDMKNIKKERLEYAVAQLEMLMKRVFTSKKIFEEVVKQKISIGLSLLKTDTLEKRILAIRLIADTCGNAKVSKFSFFHDSYATIDETEVVNSMLKVTQILEEIFGKFSHIELIQRSAEILKFFIQNGNLTNPDLEIIWNCCLRDEQSKVEIYKVIKDTIFYLSADFLKFFIDKLAKTPPELMRGLDIALLLEFSIKFSTLPNEALLQCLNIMWKVNCTPNEYTNILPEMRSRVMEKLCETLTSSYQSPEKVMNEFFARAYGLLKSNQSQAFILKFLRLSWKQAIFYTRGSDKAELITNYLKEGDILASLYKNIEENHKANIARLKEGTIIMQDHKEELREIKEFILYALSESKYQISRGELEELWRVWVAEGISANDQRVFYELLQEIISLGPINKCMKSQEEGISFFIEIICCEKNNFALLPIEGICAIEAYLVSVNKCLGNLKDLHRGGKYQEYQHGADHSSHDYLSFKVRVNPKEIKGVTILWKIVLEAKNETVTERAIELLNRLYTKLDDHQEAKIADICSDFIEIAIDKLAAFYQHMKTAQENRRKEITKLLKLIEEMIDESERKGNVGFTPLYALIKTGKIRLKIFNDVTHKISHPNILPQFEIEVCTSLTCWQLKKYLSILLKTTTDEITVLINNYGIKENDNGKTLNDVVVHTGSVITVKKKVHNDFNVDYILTNDNKLTEKAKQALAESFAKFSTDGKMSIQQCGDFKTKTTSEHINFQYDENIREIFNKFDPDRKGYVIYEHFLNFYEKAAIKKAETVWSNFQELGYKLDFFVDKEAPKIPPISPDLLPRYVLSNNKAKFDFLFSLLKLEGDIAQSSWRLILKLCPNKDRLAKILHALDGETVDWSQLFSLHESYDTLYNLIIISSLILDVTSVEAELFKEDELYTSSSRKEWKKKFFEKGGITHLCKTFEMIPEINSNSVLSSILFFALKILSSYIFASMKANNLLSSVVKQLISIEDSKQEEERQGAWANDFDSQLELAIKESKKDGHSIKEYCGSFGDEEMMFLTELKGDMAGEEGISLLREINSEQVVGCLLNIMDNFSTLTSELCQLWKEIIKLISHLFFSLIFYKPELYNRFQKPYLSLKVPIRTILINGIVVKRNRFVRDVFHSIIYFLCLNIYNPLLELHDNPLGDLVLGMLNMKLFIEEEECEELCTVLLSALDEYKLKLYNIKKDLDIKSFGAEKTGPSTQLNFIEKLIEAINCIQCYKSKEQMNSLEPDKGLLGLIKIARKILDVNGNHNEIPSKIKIKILEQLFFSCLFPLKESSSKITEFKCKVAETRAAVFTLIEAIAGFDKECLIYLVKDCLLQIPTKVEEPTAWGYSPGKDKKSSLGYLGIRNLGCICYMISMIQQFFMISPFRNALASVNDGEKPNTNNPFGIDDNMLHQFQTILGFLSLSTRQDYNPYSFCYAFKDSNNKPTNTAIQQDAHEFLNILFDRLENKLKPTPYKRVLQSIFGGKTCNQLICKKCGTVKNKIEDMYTLSLEIKNQRNFQDAMDKFISTSLITGYNCDVCKAKVEIGKRTVLSALPNVLIVHLQRFTFNFDILMNEKIHSKFEFPNSLDLYQYTEEGISEKEKANEAKLNTAEGKHDVALPEAKGGKILDDQEEKEREPVKVKKPEEATIKAKDKAYYSYKLVGIVVHNGNAEGGHYYSYINTNRGECEAEPEFLNAEKDKWAEFNDSYVRDFDFKKVPVECYGGSIEDSGFGNISEASEAGQFGCGRSRSAYMLIYERRQKTGIPILIPEKEVKPDSIWLSSLDCDSTAISRADKTKQNYYKEPNTNETYIVHDFHQVPQQISEEIQTRVNADNTKYLFERLIFDKDFADFIISLFTNSEIELRYHESPELHKTLKEALGFLADKLIFNIILHGNTTEISRIQTLPDLVTKVVYTGNLENCKTFIQNLNANSQKLFNLIVGCTDSAIRQYVSHLCLHCLLVLIDSEKDVFDKVEPALAANKTQILVPVALSRKFIDLLLSFIGNDLAAQWMRFKQYFELLRNLLTMQNEILSKYFLEKDIIALLLDFFLEKQSPFYSPVEKRTEMGSMQVYPDFDPLIDIVSSLVIRPLSMANQKQPEEKKASEHPLSSRAMKCLENPNLVTKYVKDGGKIEKLRPMISKLMNENKKYSKVSCKLMLGVINDYEMHRLQQFMPLLFDILSIKDSLQMKRIEWLMGVPQPETRSTIAISYGLEATSSITDDICNYVSPLGLQRRDYPFLQQLWKNRNRYEPLTVQGINSLLDLIEQNEVLYNYVKNLPPPTYQYGAYLDWAKDFLNSYAAAVSRYIDPFSRKEKEDLIAAAKDKLEIFICRVKSEGERPQPYMIGQFKHEKEVQSAISDDSQIKISMFEVGTEIYESKPSAPKNLALDDEYLIRHFSHTQRPDSQLTLIPDYMNFNNPTAASIMSHIPDHMAPNVFKNVGRRKTRNGKEGMEEYEEYDEDDPLEYESSSRGHKKHRGTSEKEAGEGKEIDALQIVIEGKQETKKSEEKIGINALNIGEAKGIPQKGEKEPLLSNIDVPHRSEKKIEEAKQESEKKEKLPEVDMKDLPVHQTEKEEKKAEAAGESKKEEEKKIVGVSKPLYVEGVAIMKIEVANYLPYSKKLKIMIQKDGLETESNCYLPKSEIWVNILPHATGPVWFIMKNNPGKEWDKMKIKVVIDKKSYTFQAASERPIIPPPSVHAAPSILPAEVGHPDISCPVCTLLNPWNATNCSVCSNPLRPSEPMDTEEYRL